MCNLYILSFSLVCIDLTSSSPAGHKRTRPRLLHGHTAPPAGSQALTSMHVADGSGPIVLRFFVVGPPSRFILFHRSFDTGQVTMIEIYARSEGIPKYGISDQEKSQWKWENFGGKRKERVGELDKKKR